MTVETAGAIGPILWIACWAFLAWVGFKMDGPLKENCIEARKTEFMYKIYKAVKSLDYGMGYALFFGPPILLIFALSFLPSKSDAATVENYGQLYMVEELENTAHRWKLQVSYGNELSNSFQEVHEIEGAVVYLVKPYWGLGINGSYNHVADKKFSDDLQSRLAEGGYKQNFSEPQSSAFVFATGRPLSGRLNFLQKKSVQFELWTSIGYGRSYYSDEDRHESVMWSLSLESYFTDRQGVRFGVGQDIEDPGSDENLFKTAINIGWTYKL